VPVPDNALVEPRSLTQSVLLIVIVAADGPVRTTGAVGKTIVNAANGVPTIPNTPAFAGAPTPKSVAVLAVRESSVANTTVDVVALAPTVPKFKGVVLEMLIEAKIVAEADDVAVDVDCPKDTAENPRIITAKKSNFFMFVFCFNLK
jgi:hypothetical protein